MADKLVKFDIKAIRTTDNAKELKKALEELVSEEVLVGVPDAKADRRTNQDLVTNAALAYLHNYGSPSQNIPARPFMEPGIEDAEWPISDHLLNAGRAVLDGDASAANRELHATGLIAQSSIRNKIQAGPFIPLKPATIKARKRKGHSSEEPLVVTGQLRNAIDYVVRKSK